MAEFLEFLAERPDVGPDALARLVEVQRGGPRSIPEEDRAAVTVPGLHCLLCDGWGVFYAAPPPGPGSAFDIVVLHVAPVPFGRRREAEGEAARRMRTVVQ